MRMADKALDKKTIQSIQTVLEKDKTAIVKPTRDGIKVFEERRILIRDTENNKWLDKS